MKAVRINEPKNVVLADIEKPTPKAGEALIRITQPESADPISVHSAELTTSFPIRGLLDMS